MSGTIIEGISLYIPTYNRRDQLIRLLKSIESSDYTDLYEIIISDNNSPYNVLDEILKEFPIQFCEKCRIHINNTNIGSSGNIRNAFLYCKTKWLWIIGDDDEILQSSIKTIKDKISENPESAFLKFSTETECNGEVGILKEDNCQMKSLQDLIDYYKKRHNSVRSIGSLVFISNNIINIELLAPYIRYAFEYSTSVSHTIPALMGLDDSKIHINYYKDTICRYHLPTKQDRWDVLRVMVNITSITILPFVNATYNQREDIYKLFACCDFHYLVRWVLDNKEGIYDWNRIKYVYKNYYIHTKIFYYPLVYFLLWLEIKYNVKLLSTSVRFWRFLKKLLDK